MTFDKSLDVEIIDNRSRVINDEDEMCSANVQRCIVSEKMT